MTLRQFLETPIFEPPFAWVKILATVVTFVMLMLAVIGIDSFRRRS